MLVVVLEVTATIVVAGCVYYAVSTVIEKIKSNKKKQKYYYKAYIDVTTQTTYIAFYSKTITKKQAASRIKSGNNIYTFTKKKAKAAVVAAGLGYVGPEIHLRKGKFVFHHFHTRNRNGAHSLYGMPYTK